MTFHEEKGVGACATCVSPCEKPNCHSESQAPDRRYKRGYDTKHLTQTVQTKLKDAEVCKPIANIAEALLTVASIPLVAVLFVTAMSYLPQLTSNPAIMAGTMGLLYFTSAIVIARQQRALEILVHDVSHLTWFRDNPKVNNLLGDLLVAYPVLSSVVAYWKSHRIHHGAFGSKLDPCRQRFADMGLAHIDLSTKWKITKAVIAWLPAYNAAYYKEIGSQSVRQWVTFWLWHIVVMIAPTAVLLATVAGFEAIGAVSVSFVAWVMFWMLPAITILPVIRSIAESEEHDYTAGDTEFDTTYTNDGWVHRLLIHPKNDSYHVVHHMFPNIPERRHRRVHKLLMKHDARYRAALRRSDLLDM